MSQTNARSSTLIARLLWAVPISLLLLAVHQLKVGFDLRNTLVEGELLSAEVTGYDRVDRKDITHGHVSLAIPMKDGSMLEKSEMPLPYSLLHRVEGKERLDVYVLPGSAQEVVIQLVANAQWKMAVIQSSMALVAALIALLGVVAWQRYLKSHGDPAYPRGSPGYMSATNSA